MTDYVGPFLAKPACTRIHAYEKFLILKAENGHVHPDRDYAQPGNPQVSARS